MAENWSVVPFESPFGACRLHEQRDFLQQTTRVAPSDWDLTIDAREEDRNLRHYLRFENNETYANPDARMWALEFLATRYNARITHTKLTERVLARLKFYDT